MLFEFIESGLDKIAVFVGVRGFGIFRQACQNKGIGEIRFFGLFDITFLIEKVMPASVALIPVFDDKISTALGQVQPMRLIFHIVVKRGKEPQLTALTP